MTDSELFLAKLLLKAMANSKSPDDFLKLMVHSVLKKYNARGIVLVTVNNQSRFDIRSFYGLEETTLDYLSAETLTATPLGAAILNSEVYTFRYSKQALEMFPSVKKLHEAWVSSIVIPFETSDSLIGACWITFNETLDDSALSKTEIELIQLAAELSLNFEKDRANRNLYKSGLEAQLTEKEKEIAKLILAGLTNYQIAKRINISESWVKKINQLIYKKLGIQSRAQLITKRGLFD